MRSPRRKLGIAQRSRAAAAAAIANARAHRGEQRARRDLEALIETTPVGAVVFDVASGRMVSSNREARRIGAGTLSVWPAPTAVADVVEGGRSTFLTGGGRDETIARAFEQGADDTIVKPFSPTELVARIRAALRRHREPERFVLGALAIEYDRRAVTVGGEPVELTATEYELLRLLSVNAGRVVHHDTTLRRIWGGRDGADANLVRIFVRTLRAKLGDSAENPTWIFNLRGVGYRMPRPGEG